MEGALIVVAALLILREAWRAWIAPEMLTIAPAGLALSAGATVLNVAWARVLLRSGRRLKSPALEADGRHLMTDVVTSVGVVVGLILVGQTGLVWLDPAIAVLVAANVLWSGWCLMRASIAGLMDEAPGPEVLARVETLIASHGEGALQAHDLRMRRTGPLTFVEFHLIVPGGMTVARSHVICDRIEAALRGALEDAVISIHVEPDHKSKSGDVVAIEPD